MLEVPDDLAGERGLAPPRTAQLADDAVPTIRIEVNLLACQWCTPAVRAGAAGSLEGPDTAAQQHELQLLHVVW